MTESERSNLLDVQHAAAAPHALAAAAERCHRLAHYLTAALRLSSYA